MTERERRGTSGPGGSNRVGRSAGPRATGQRAGSEETVVTAAQRRRLRAVRDRLRLVYGIPVLAPHGDPLAELVLTVLSQSTNDRNRDGAYLELRARFPTWEEVRDAPVAEVEAAIRGGGISKVKSVRIQAILAMVSETGAAVASALGAPVELRPAAGELGLSWLSAVGVPAARDYLCSLPGVGRKTAACVLLFSYGMPDIPVDTHVSRVGTRLGLFRAGAPFEELHDVLLALTPRGQEWEVHINMLRHGRRTCHARSPECEACALERMCPKVGV